MIVFISLVLVFLIFIWFWYKRSKHVPAKVSKGPDPANDTRQSISNLNVPGVEIYQDVQTENVNYQFEIDMSTMTPSRGKQFKL